MTKFEFVLNKFYEITAWSLFAAVAMTVLNGDYDTVPASLLWQIPLLSFLGALSSLIYPWDRSMTRKEFVILHCHSLSDYEWDCAWWWQLVWLV